MRRAALGAVLAVVLSGCGTQAPTPPELTPATVPPLDHPVKPDGSCNCVPKAIRIPSIGLVADTVGQVGLQPDGTMEVPPLSRAKDIDWYRFSPVPGDLGPAVVISHRNGDGQQGGFAQLDKVQVGDKVDIDRTDGLTAEFTVTKTELIPKSQADQPDKKRKVYGNTVDPEIRLITCSGTLNRSIHSYDSNRLVSGYLSSLHKTVTP